MPTRIEPLFAALKAQRRAALIAYVTAGDPSPERTPQIVAALERGGVDLIELGVPFSDPIADGPVIQAGAERALKAGTTLHKVLEIARTIRQTSQIPLLLFTYLNPAMRYGFEKLGRDAKAAGIDGCLLTDLSVEEAEPYVNSMREAGLDTVFLAAPTSTAERLHLVAQYSTGFVYLGFPHRSHGRTYGFVGFAGTAGGIHARGDEVFRWRRFRHLDSGASRARWRRWRMASWWAARLCACSKSQRERRCRSKRSPARCARAWTYQGR